ncbi:MAG: hypothetical protein HQ516_02645 [Chlorobium sp.]|nr:hypothetical protein [Chlorobium sp.]
MKKMLSLAAMFAVLAYASPASAELKISGDASTRLRGQYIDDNGNNTDDLYFSYRVRLKGAADLGDGYFFKTMLTNDNLAGGWTSVGTNNTESAEIEVSNFYFGRKMEESHYAIGRLPMGSFNNPIYDLALYPIPRAGVYGSTRYTLDIPFATYNMDRMFGMNYGTKIGDGELNTTLIVFSEDSDGNTESEGDGFFGDSYGLHLSYKFNVGDITIDPQAIIALTDGDGNVYQNVSSNTVGANIAFPAGRIPVIGADDVKLSVSGFYTWCTDNNGKYDATTTTTVDYDAILLRLKAEKGSAMAWVDYSRANDDTNGRKADYDSVFLWAQYKFSIYESAAGSFSLTPALRYLASTTDNAETDTETDYSKVRTELIATVTF